MKSITYYSYTITIFNPCIVKENLNFEKTIRLVRFHYQSALNRNVKLITNSVGLISKPEESMHVFHEDPFFLINYF